MDIEEDKYADLVKFHFEDIVYMLIDLDQGFRAMVITGDSPETIDISAEKKIKLMKIYLEPISRSVSIVEQATDDVLANLISPLCVQLMTDFEKSIAAEVNDFHVDLIIDQHDIVVYHLSLMRTSTK